MPAFTMGRVVHTLTPRVFTRMAQGATLNRLASTSTPATSVLKGSHSKLKILGSAQASPFSALSSHIKRTAPVVKQAIMASLSGSACYSQR